MQIKAENISFSYKNKPILRDVNLKISNGELIGLFGDSGSGKTTLGKIIAGYIKKYQGTVTLGDKPLPKKGYNPIQLIFQHPEKTLNPKVKMKTSLNESWNVSEDVIESMGIKPEWMNRYPTELSGGELQRFALARAIGPQTKFIIADEITTMLDAITQAQIWEIMAKIAKERDIGILVVSHNKKLMERLCEKTIYLNDINKI